MAQLILTQEEQDAVSWLDVSDETLGKLCRKWCVLIPTLDDKQKPLSFSIAMMLCNFCAEANSTNSKFSFEGLSRGDKQHGDWVITIKRTKKPKAHQPQRAND